MKTRIFNFLVLFLGLAFSLSAMDFKTVEKYVKKQGFNIVNSKNLSRYCFDKAKAIDPESLMAFEIDYNNNGRNEWVVFIEKIVESKDLKGKPKYTVHRKILILFDEPTGIKEVLLENFNYVHLSKNEIYPIDFVVEKYTENTIKDHEKGKTIFIKLKNPVIYAAQCEGSSYYVLNSGGKYSLKKIWVSD
jgi:hypothetical protein